MLLPFDLNVFLYHIRPYCSDQVNIRLFQTSSKLYLFYQQHPFDLQRRINIHDYYDPGKFRWLSEYQPFRITRLKVPMDAGYSHMFIKTVFMDHSTVNDVEICVNTTVALHLPDHLQHLSLGSPFHGFLGRVFYRTPLPTCLLSFKIHHNIELSNISSISLPSTLTHLEILDASKLTLTPGFLPVSLTKLVLDNKIMNRSLEPGLFDSNTSLTYLDLGRYDRIICPHVFPEQLTTLIMNYYVLIDNILPPRLMTLSCLQWAPVSPFPNSITKLRIKNYVSNEQSFPLPTSLVSIKFDTMLPINQIILPIILKEITFGQWFNQPLPSSISYTSIETLELTVFFNQPLPPLPSTLAILILGPHYSQSSPIIFLSPSRIKKIKYGFFFNHALVTPYPHSLKSLCFGNRFNQVISRGILPPGLESLQFGDVFNQPLYAPSIPTSLQRLTMSPCFCRASIFLEIPSSTVVVIDTKQTTKQSQQEIYSNKIKNRFLRMFPQNIVKYQE